MTPIISKNQPYQINYYNLLYEVYRVENESKLTSIIIK
jgi:hypothetical protein